MSCNMYNFTKSACKFDPETLDFLDFLTRFFFISCQDVSKCLRRFERSSTKVLEISTNAAFAVSLTNHSIVINRTFYSYCKVPSEKLKINLGVCGSRMVRFAFRPIFWIFQSLQVDSDVTHVVLMVYKQY